MTLPILQFGTSRFLQAHADLFVSEAAKTGAALGKIAVVQSSGSGDRLARVEAFNQLPDFPVRIRGLRDGIPVDSTIRVDSIGRALVAERDWQAILDLVARETQVIISNTADLGYRLSDADRPGSAPNGSFPAKLLALLKHRFASGGAPLSIIPCELISRNAERLRSLVQELAERWGEAPELRRWIDRECIWASSLVDRIVSEAIEPIGAVAEPYAIWAIEQRPGLVVPCRHPDIVVTQDLDRYERLKLHILNLGHTYLVEIWRSDGRPEDETVLEIMIDARCRARLDDVYDQEVLPIFAALGLGDAAPAYRNSVIERFSNPFLRHYLREIAGNHAEKKLRRIARLLDIAREAGMTRRFPLLEAALG